MPSRVVSPVESVWIRWSVVPSSPTARSSEVSRGFRASAGIRHSWPSRSRYSIGRRWPGSLGLVGR